jgi:hypothetical protein
MSLLEQHKKEIKNANISKQLKCPDRQLLVPQENVQNAVSPFWITWHNRKNCFPLAIPFGNGSDTVSKIIKVNDSAYFIGAAFSLLTKVDDRPQLPIQSSPIDDIVKYRREKDLSSLWNISYYTKINGYKIRALGTNKFLGVDTTTGVLKFFNEKEVDETVITWNPFYANKNANKINSKEDGYLDQLWREDVKLLDRLVGSIRKEFAGEVYSSQYATLSNSKDKNPSKINPTASPAKHTTTASDNNLPFQANEEERRELLSNLRSVFRGYDNNGDEMAIKVIPQGNDPYHGTLIYKKYQLCEWVFDYTFDGLFFEIKLREESMQKSLRAGCMNIPSKNMQLSYSKTDDSLNMLVGNKKYELSYKTIN